MHEAPMIRIRLIVIESPRIVEYRFHGANYQLFERGAIVRELSELDGFAII